MEVNLVVRHEALAASRCNLPSKVAIRDHRLGFILALRVGARLDFAWPFTVALKSHENNPRISIFSEPRSCKGRCRCIWFLLVRVFRMAHPARHLSRRRPPPSHQTPIRLPSDSHQTPIFLQQKVRGRLHKRFREDSSFSSRTRFLVKIRCLMGV